MLAKIEEKDFLAHYDPTKETALVIIFSPSVPSGVFQKLDHWIAELRAANHAVHAILMDLQHLRSFPKRENADQANERLAQYTNLLGLPVALVVANQYQERKMNEYVGGLTSIENSQIVMDYVAAFDYIDKFHKLNDVQNDDFTLSTKYASVRMDLETGITHIIYYGVVTAQATADVYGQMFANLDILGVETVKAGIFDFRHVNKFDNSNLQTVKRSSGTMNKTYDMSHIAVPLVVGNFHQEQMVRLALKVSPQEERKKIVFSMDEASQFITEFHKNREAPASTG